MVATTLWLARTTPTNTPEQVGAATQPQHSGAQTYNGHDRADLEARAAKLGVKFRSNIADATLAARVESAEQEAAKPQADAAPNEGGPQADAEPTGEEGNT